MALMLEGMSIMALMAILVLICCGVVDAQSNCPTLILSLSPCLGYVTGGGDNPPTTACCTAFASVVTSNATCLCEVLNGNSAIPNFNQTTALGLPTACNVVIPPISTCQQTVAEVPANGPSPSTVPPLPDVPAEGSSPSIVPPPIAGGTPNSGALLTSSVVMIVSMVGLILLKDLF